MRNVVKNWMLVIALLVLLLAMVLSGCSINSRSETVEFPATVNGERVMVKYTNEIWQGLFLYWSSAKGIENITDWSSFVMGEIESQPDPNSVEKISEGAVNALLNYGL